MSKTCLGCGIKLQHTDKNALGYSPKEDAQYCQRCFRITHYNDVMVSMQQGIDSDAVLHKASKMDALVLWVADIFDFEANLIKGMNRHFKGKDIVLVATKRDLLPYEVSDEKLAQFLIQRLKDMDMIVQGIVICADMTNADESHNDSIKEIRKAISLYRKNRDIVVVGMANAGKSTMLNALLASKKLTTSRHPGTTLDFNAISFEGYHIYDTPGLVRSDSLLTHMDTSLLKTVVPYKRIKPVQYQLKGNQSIALGGLVRLDLSDCDNAVCVCYFSNEISLHRGKLENANRLWSEHLGELLSPSLDTNYTNMKVLESGMPEKKMDVVIHGLGWFCLSGSISNVKVYVNKKIDVTFRGAMI